MSRKSFKSFYLLLFLALNAYAFKWDPVAKQYYVEDRLLIKTKKNANEKELSKIINENNSTEDTAHGKRHPGLKKALRLRGIKINSSKFESTLKKLKALAADKKNTLIESVERDWIARPSATSIDPNDPYYKDQWHHISIDTPGAWALNTGSSNITIAIIDTGIDFNHPDLSNKILPGYNFFSNDNNPIDEDGHGTAVAGTATAITNNGIGVAGVSWNSKILPVRISDATGSATYSAMAQGIIYAADNGARVINISFGGPSSSITLQNAIDYAWSKNAVIVAAAGNDYGGPVSFPGACDNVIGVSATQSNNTLTSFSNYGSEINLAAPGLNIYTTKMGGSYQYIAGTSFSSPIVAGVAALILSKNQKLTNAQVVNILESNTNDLGAPGFDTSFGYGKVNAYKALNATPADTTPGVIDKTPPTVRISSPSNGVTVTGNLTVSADGTDNIGIYKIDFFVDGTLTGSSNTNPATFTLNTTKYLNGSHILVARAMDSAGNQTYSQSISINISNPPPTDTTPPTVYISYPLNGTSLGGTIKATLVGSDNVGISKLELFIDGTLFESSTLNPATFTLDTLKYSNGSHILTAQATDKAGNKNLVLPKTYINVWNAPAPSSDKAPPTVAITAPLNNSTIVKDTTISLNSSDDLGVKKVELYINNIFVYAYTFQTPTKNPTLSSLIWKSQNWPTGAYSLQAFAYDVAGKKTASAIIKVKK